MAKTSLGKAYVQIIPSADGITGSISKVLDPESKSAGISSGKSAGSSLVSSLKSTLIALGIGKVIADAFNEGGKIQQSFGGLETIYGEAAEQAKQFAYQASQAGISANNYAEQAVSFGASLKQAFGGDTTKAMESANMAIMDMADNSAKMGTDIQSIQNAYQGFARGQYQLLDNLKLGYGGTKTEMERLLSDAQKLTGVKYDISNLGDVYSAIHVIQGELGIAGVAVEEAKTTFTGSFNAMKVSMANFLGVLTTGQGDIAQITRDLVTSTVTFIGGNLIPMAIQMASNLPSAIIEGINTALPMLEQGARDLMTNFMAFMTNEFPNVMTTGTNMLNNFVQGIIDNLPAIINAALQIIITLVNSVVANFPTIVSTGISLIGQLLAGILQSLPSLFSGVVSAFGSFDWISIGKNMIQGVIDGISSMAGSLWEAAKSVAKSAWDAVTGFFGIHSPSTKMRWAGQMIDNGLVAGLKDGHSLIKDEMTSISKELSSPITKDLTLNASYNANRGSIGGYSQTVNIYSPTELSPSEVARQTRNATRQMALSLGGVR